MKSNRKDAVTRTLKRLVEATNRHDAEGCAAAFTEHATLWDQSWDETYENRGAIERYYGREFAASSDLEVSLRTLYFADDTVALEATIRGTHDGEWRSLPATGNRFEVATWTALRMSGNGLEVIDARRDYDRATLFQQLGILHDPGSILGKAVTALAHPLTMAQAARRRISSPPTTAH